jgi:peptidoglycan/xylan/chitin deacetylase (PgdA/CDA1 family)
VALAAVGAGLLRLWRGAVGPAPGVPRIAVAPRVTVGDRPVGELDRARARAYLAALAATVDVAPLEPTRDPEDGGLVPGLPGVSLDVDATLQALLKAPPGAHVAPVMRPVPPRIRLADLPAAPVYHGNRGQQATAFVINVAWGQEWLPDLLDDLRAQGVTATFCLVGRWAEAHPELTRAIADAGNELCNHGYREAPWPPSGEAAARASIAQADAAIERLTGGRRPVWFSPHRGEWNPGILAAARAEGHETILWSLDTIDWRNPSVGQVLQRTVGRARPGDIILMHPTAVTAEALPEMIRGLRAKGLPPETVGALFGQAR